MTVKKRAFDPHAVAARILPTLNRQYRDLTFRGGAWYHAHSRLNISRGTLEAITSRLVREDLDGTGDTERPVTSALVREVLLALSSLRVEVR